MDDYAGASPWAQDNIYEDSLLVLSTAVRNAACQKCVEIAPREVKALAEQIAETLDLADHYRLVRAEGAACDRAAAAIQCALDRHYFTQVGIAITVYFGMPDAAATYIPAFVDSATQAVEKQNPPDGYKWDVPPQDYAAELICARPFMHMMQGFKDGGVATVYKRFWKAPRGDFSLLPGGIARPPWQLMSELHRPSAEGPALQIRDARGRVTAEIYAEHDKRHRDPALGPAFFERFEDDGRIRFVTEYWVNGVLHRPSEQGPAAIETDEHGRVELEVYMEHGKRHRDSREGPAFFKVNRETGQTECGYFWEGSLHRDARQGPAIVKRDASTGAVVCEEYYRHGLLHRDEADGPAIVLYDAATGILVIEHYYRDGNMHRNDAPAAIERDPCSGTIVREEYCRNGETHHEGGPAILVRSLETEAITEERHYRNGALHRDDGPAEILRRADGTVHYEAWYRDGALVAERGSLSDEAAA
jgi:hypothetical protein